MFHDETERRILRGGRRDEDETGLGDGLGHGRVVQQVQDVADGGRVVHVLVGDDGGLRAGGG